MQITDLKYIKDEKPQGFQQEVEDDEDEADEAAQPHALWNVTIERQVFDLLAAADMDGLCLRVSFPFCDV